MTDQPEPCLGGRCYSPLACGGFGYCRNRNRDFPDGAPSDETRIQWRTEALKRKTDAMEAKHTLRHVNGHR